VPFTLVATVDDVRTRAKEFASLLDPEITTALNDAAAQINVTFFGGAAAAKTVLAQTYLAAHLLSIRNPQLATPAGPVSEDKVGEVSASYAVAGGLRSESDWNLSRWGREYQTLARQCIAARLPIGAGPSCW
jgi:hypothetical protein